MGDFGQDIAAAYAAVTLLSEEGIPTPVVHTRLRPPGSRIGPADDVDAAAKASPLFAKYGTRAEAESARERLARRLYKAQVEAPARKGSTPAEDARRISKRRRKEAATATGGGAGVLGDFLGSREGEALGRKVARGVFGMLRKRL
jgi:uncharacterized protein